MTMQQKFAFFTVSHKGGVGKTHVALALADYLRRKPELKVGLFDLDASVADFMRLAGTKDENRKVIANQDPLVGVGGLDVHEKDHRRMIGEAASQKLGADMLLFDAPGGSIKKISSVFPTGESFTGFMNSEGFQPVFLVVFNAKAAAVRSIKATIDHYGPNARYVAIRNLGMSKPESFVLFDRPEINPDAIPLYNKKGDGKPVSAQEYLEKSKGLLVDMPESDERAMILLDHFGLSVSEALAAPAQESNGGPITPQNKWLIAEHRRVLDEMFDELFAKL